MTTSRRTGAVGVHFVGSFPKSFQSTEDVFRIVGPIYQDRLPRLPDGEVGKRHQWLIFQLEVFSSNPLWAELIRSFTAPAEDGAGARELSDAEVEQAASEIRRSKKEGGPNLQYDDFAIESYGIFRRLRDQGIISSKTRFQVSLPTPAAVMIALVKKQYRARIGPAYEEALLHTLRSIQEAIPHEDLCIQWDVCSEILALEKIEFGEGPVAYFVSEDAAEGEVEQAILDNMMRVTTAVSPDVEVGYHLCYGDHDHKHFKEPEDLGVLASLAIGLLDTVGRARRIEFIHMPVPKARVDEAYFAPLRNLRPVSGNNEETMMVLGLLHPFDEEGTRARIETAAKFIPRFLVSTECGMGRTPPEHFESLIAIGDSVTK